MNVDRINIYCVWEALEKNFFSRSFKFQTRPFIVVENILTKPSSGKNAPLASAA